ncbi:MAG: hypothetical protein ACYCUV_13955, partial [Phycisphaerae bacterium]
GGTGNNNLSSVSFWTDKLLATPGDWYVNLYTTPTGNNDAASWYHDRFTFLTSSGSYQSSAPTNTWTQASTGGSSDQLLLSSIAYGNGGSTPAYNVNWTPTDTTLASLEGDSTYNNQTIEYLVLETASNATTLRSLVDGLQFSTSDGSSATFNLEAATPIPGSGLLAAVGGLALIGGMALRRRMAKIH